MKRVKKEVGAIQLSQTLSQFDRKLKFSIAFKDNYSHFELFQCILLENETFKQATGTMILLVYVGSMVI